MGLVEQEQVIELPERFYTTDHYTTKAIEFMAEARQQARPFFVHLCLNAPHWPLHAWPEDIAKYRGKYCGGWDAIRTARHEQLNSLGILDVKWDISPRDSQSPEWSDVQMKDWEDARMATYAAMVDRVDQNIGRIIRHLEAAGQLDNRLILFVSDNGGSAEGLMAGPRKMELQTTRDGQPMRFGNVQGLEPGGPDTFMSYELPWANVSNCPFRRFKSWVHEGGISTPCIAHWPAAIAAGSIRHETAHFTDITATIYDLAGAWYPKEYGGNAIVPIEGESFASLLRGRPWQRQAPICWEHQGNRAVRRDSLKLVSANPGKWELYDMSRDRTELHDLSAQYPQTVAEMACTYETWAKRCGVEDWAVIQKG